MEFTEVDKLLIDIFIATPRNEKNWEKVSDYFSRLVEVAEETMIVEWPNSQIQKPTPYVQLRKDSYRIYLEAVSGFYVDGDLPVDTKNSLRALGWQSPEFENEDGRNFNIEFYGDEPNYKLIGELIMKTFRYGYACILSNHIEISPHTLAEQVPYVAAEQPLPAQLTDENGAQVKKNGKKVFPSLVNKEALPKASFETIDERNQYVVEKRKEGYTLQGIADSLGLTREMIRLIVNAKSGPSAQSVRDVRKAKQEAEVKSLAKNMTEPDIDVLADRLEINPTKVRKLLGSKAKKFPQGRRNFEQEFTNEELIATLQKYSALAEGPLTAKKFIELGGAPTIVIFIMRFGSWIKACEAAGIESGKAFRANYSRAHTEESMIAFVESYLADPRTNGTAAGYDIWQRSVEGAPSLALIRQRIGRWNDIKARILKEGK